MKYNQLGLYSNKKITQGPSWFWRCACGKEYEYTFNIILMIVKGVRCGTRLFFPCRFILLPSGICLFYFRPQWESANTSHYSVWFVWAITNMYPNHGCDVATYFFSCPRSMFSDKYINFVGVSCKIEKDFTTLYAEQEQSLLGISNIPGNSIKQNACSFTY